MGKMGGTDSPNGDGVRAIGVFANLAYLPAAATLINSILHFQVRARIKIYDFEGLPHLARTYLARYAEIVAPSPGVFDDRYREQWNYRPRMLAESLDPFELQMDADTVVLADLEDAFCSVEQGNFVAVREWEYDHAGTDEKGRDQRARELPADSVFHRILRHPEIHHRGLPIYNAGLLGLNREHHMPLINLWAQSTYDFKGIEGTFFQGDQNKLGLIVASLREEGRLRVHELPKHLWMQTWDDHREPQKFLSFESGRIALHNGSPGEIQKHRMHFYHFTGDVAAPGELTGEPNRHPVRFNAFVSDLDLPAGITQSQMIDSWHHVWRIRHRSPAGELPLYFYNLGPVRAPRCLDPVWREFVGLHVNGAGRDSRETWAVALAYDYIDYAGFRAGDLGWIAGPLGSLMGPERMNKGKNAISWQRPAHVSLSFESGFDDRRPWAGAETPEQHALRMHYSEFHRGVFVNIGPDGSL
jgi:hypothetical protein